MTCIRCGEIASVDWFGGPYCAACALQEIGTEAAKHYWVLYGGTYVEQVSA